MKIPITISTKPKQTLVAEDMPKAMRGHHITNAKEKAYVDLLVPSCGSPTEYDLSTSLPHQDWLHKTTNYFDSKTFGQKGTLIPVEFPEPKQIQITPLRINILLALAFFIIGLASAIIINENRNAQINTTMNRMQELSWQMDYNTQQIKNYVQDNATMHNEWKQMYETLPALIQERVGKKEAKVVEVTAEQEHAMLRKLWDDLKNIRK